MSSDRPTTLEPATRPASKLDPGERLVLLDVLRGFALLGMFIVHFHVRSTDPGGVDDLFRQFVWRFVETKSHGTFALLFGAGFAIQLQRATARGEPFVPRYVRRLAVLALFGFSAHVLFGYNVLLGYAIWAIPLLFIHQWSTRTLLVVAAVSSASIVLFQLAAFATLRYMSGPDAATAAIEAQQTARTAVFEQLDAARAQDSYATLVSARLHHLAWFQRQPFSIMPGVTLALFIVGLLFVRHRVFERPHDHRRALVSLAAFGFVSWAADNWVLPAYELESFGLLRDQWLTFTYVAGAVLLLANKPTLIDWLRPVAAAGRLALTNYLLQIAALDLIFSGYAIGLGLIRPRAALPTALVAFALEAAFSMLWLRRFHMGPAEWLWRSLSEVRMQPVRRPA